MDAADIKVTLPQRELKKKEDEATATGVDRSVLVPSPSCKKKTRRHLQPDIHLPRNKQTAPSKTITSITWPMKLSPQHETAPPLDSAQECTCTQNVTIPRPPPHKPQTSITRKLKSPNHNNTANEIPTDCRRMHPKHSSYAAITTPILPRPKQASQRRCPNQQQPRASIDRFQCHRRAAQKKHVVTCSPTYISPATNKQLPQKQ